jgi:CHAT domain-containing protein
LLRALAPLPETADEVRRVALTLRAGPEAIVLGRDVNEPALRKLPLDQYRVVYFATHGLLPGELRCQSEPGLALSPPAGDPTGVGDDGLLDASEVASLRLDADLVVLSACNTGGAGGRFGGQALSGLAEAFFYAGGRALLVSHWQVPSVPTVALMTGLFETVGPELKGGVAAALRGVQLKLAGAPETAHPFYWAAFTLVGDGAAAGEATTPPSKNPKTAQSDLRRAS